MVFERVLNEIIEKAKISKEELIERIREKQKELQIISFEGAAYLVAKDLGIDLLEFKPRRLEMRNIVSGMKNVNVIGKIFKISPIVEFEREGRRGRVVNLFVSDGTDYVKIALWNDQVQLIEDQQLRVGDTIQIIAGVAKENPFGEKEIVLRKLGRISLSEEKIDASVEELQQKFLLARYERAELKNITQGNFEVIARIVHVFRGNFIFGVCPICGLTCKSGERVVCEVHGEIKPNYHLVIPCIIDDGTANLRCVFFRELAEEVCGISANELKEVEVEQRHELISSKLLGKEFLLRGRVRKNRIFDRLELIVNEVKGLDYLGECEKLIKSLGEKLQT